LSSRILHFGWDPPPLSHNVYPLIVYGIHAFEYPPLGMGCLVIVSTVNVFIVHFTSTSQYNSKCCNYGLTVYVFDMRFNVYTLACKELKSLMDSDFNARPIYRAMLCIRGTSHMALCLSVRPSVCLSVCPSQVGVLLKRLNVGSHK